MCRLLGLVKAELEIEYKYLVLWCLKYELNNIKPAKKESLLSVLQLVQRVAPLPLLRVKPIYLAGQSPAKENSARCRQGKTW